VAIALSSVIPDGLFAFRVVVVVRSGEPLKFLARWLQSNGLWPRQIAVCAMAPRGAYDCFAPHDDPQSNHLPTTQICSFSAFRRLSRASLPNGS